MKENPWKKKIENSRSSTASQASRKGTSQQSRQVGRTTRPAIRSKTSRTSRQRAQLTSEEARSALFAAGWHPSMTGKPVTDPKIRQAMMDLNDADIRRTRARIKAMS